MTTDYNKPFKHDEDIMISAPIPQINFEDEIVTKHIEAYMGDVINAVVINCERLNVRDVASLKGKVLEIIPINSNLIVLEFISKDWAHVYTEHEIDGYVMMQYIKEA